MSGDASLIKLKNGYTIPALGLGTWKSQPGLVGDAVKAAIDVGYRHIDCAHIYSNEKEVGDALKDKFSSGVIKREDIFITSKLWCTFHRSDLVPRTFATSLEDLGLEYLDLYLIHFPQAYQEDGDPFPRNEDGKVIYSDVDYVDTWKAMEGLVESGLVKSIGLSNFNKKQIDRVLAVAKIKPAVIQIEVHPYLTQQKLIDYCRSLDMVVTAYSPLGSPDRSWVRPGEATLLANPKIKSVANKYGKSPAQVLIRFALDRGLVVIPKSVTAARIAQNYQVFDFQLTPEDIALISSLECNGRLVCLGDIDHRDYPFHDDY